MIVQFSNVVYMANLKFVNQKKNITLFSEENGSKRGLALPYEHEQMDNRMTHQEFQLYFHFLI
jgi:hypothetical protein